MIQRFWLKSHNHARNSLARLLRDFHQDPEADVQKFRAEIYAFSVLLSYFNLEIDANFEKRLEKLEALFENWKIEKYGKAGKAFN